VTGVQVDAVETRLPDPPGRLAEGVDDDGDFLFGRFLGSPSMLRVGDDGRRDRVDRGVPALAPRVV